MESCVVQCMNCCDFAKFYVDDRKLVVDCNLFDYVSIEKNSQVIRILPKNILYKAFYT